MAIDYYKQIGQSGEALIKAINSLTQIARMHLDNNDLLVDAAKKFIGLIEKLGQNRDNVSIRHSDGRFYFQEEKLYLRRANKRLFNRMLRYLENRSIYGFHFKSNLRGVAYSKIIDFARLVNRAVQHDDPSEWLGIQLERNDLNWVDINQHYAIQPSEPIVPFAEIPKPDELAAKKEQARKSYAHVLSSVKEVAHKLSSNQNVGMRNSVRLIQKMVDMITEDESFFLILSTLRIYDDYTYLHSLNVAILSMCLGKRIGLTHIALERLGLCGLFHDLGKVEISKHILNKRGRLEDEEYAELKKHSMHSARLILKMKTKRDRKVKILMPPFEHHMGYDHSGYPRINTRRNISLFGRILTIADVYDAITSPRIYRQLGLSPDKALGYMMTQSGSFFDPILLKVFINMLGAYPVGTLLKLDTGEMGIVIQSSIVTDRTRPMVQLLAGDAQQKYTKGPIVNLSERDAQTGLYQRNISESMHPSSMGIQAAEFLI